MKKNSGAKLWKRAKKIIPGGNMLFSKRAELFLPGEWISYYSKTQDAYVWDLDNKKYLDMMFYVGTSTLGYNQPAINEHVKKIIDSGVMSSLNCKEEVLLSEKLVELHPWADMVRLCRSGGEANAIAIRIARAASGKDNVAICGYHGWHDWYLSANIKNKKLNNHAVLDLPVEGVPKNLSGTVFPFDFNNYEQLEKIIKKNNIGVIKMEVTRSSQPKDNFLQKIRKLATKNKIVLIFDECTSGFRETNGGIHKLFNVEPDMAMFGKALGNGYAITAVIGKKEIMEAAQNSFISSTFWSERIGPAAALKTLEVMKSHRSWEILPKIGEEVKNKWREIFENFDIDFEIYGMSAIPCFNFKGKDALKYKTLFTKLMLERKILASNIIFISLAHNNKRILRKYFDAFYECIKIISNIKKGKKIKKYSNIITSHTSFKRLN
tara:strand:+ start:5036 stop:6343 length:1308 start_codon:yes stop_codon:yes gene_type:complete